MKQRGHKSGAQLATVTSLLVAPPEPPAELTGEAIEIWRETVSTLPSNWFPRDVWPLLACYCRNIATNRALSKLINAIDVNELKIPAVREEWSHLLKLRMAESNSAMRLATKLRLTNQSRLDPKTAHRAVENKPQGKRPWE
jgi:hypothetical protein